MDAGILSDLWGSEASARQLLCTRCTSLWNYSRVGCPFCGAKERQIYYLGENGLYRLYVCPECKGYLKTVDLQQAKRPVQPMVERLLTVSMDLAAWEEGWGNQQQVAAAD
jgi:FdhE protein